MALPAVLLLRVLSDKSAAIYEHWGGEGKGGEDLRDSDQTMRHGSSMVNVDDYRTTAKTRGKKKKKQRTLSLFPILFYLTFEGVYRT